MTWNTTSERPRGRVEKGASLQLGGGSEKTYFAQNGAFVRRLRVTRVGLEKLRSVSWLKLDPTFINLDGSFKKR